MDGIDPEVMKTKIALKEVMSREIDLLRELFGSMYEEQQAHLTNDVNSLKSILSKREKRLVDLGKERTQRLELVDRLYLLIRGENPEKPQPDEHESLDILTEYASTESCEILMLRDQMLALLDQMTEQGNRNNYLLEGKISYTRNLLQRIHPSDPNTTYGTDGNVKKVRVKTKVSLFNREV